MAEPQHQFPIEPYRSPRPSARTLLTLMGIALGLDLIAVAFGLAERSLLGRAQRGEVISFEEAEANDSRVIVISIAQTGLLLVIIPVFIVWFRRMYRNLPALGARNLRFKPGWAVGAWFVPFLNLVRPVQMTGDIWKASEPDMSQAPDTPWKIQNSTALIGFWWASWLIANYAANFAFRISGDGDDLESLQDGSFAWLVADSLSVIATVIAIALVWRMTARQQQRAQRLVAAGALQGSA